MFYKYYKDNTTFALSLFTFYNLFSLLWFVTGQTLLWFRLASALTQTHPLLDELEGSLVLGHFQQLHGSPLIRSKPTHFTDHIPHKLGVFGQTLGSKDISTR